MSGRRAGRTALHAGATRDGAARALTMVGVNHRSAPLSTRERLHVTALQTPEALAAIAAQLEATPAELLLLSTCNRTEVYAWCAAPEAAIEASEDFLARRAGGSSRAALRAAPRAALRPHLLLLRGAAAVEHLMQTAAGLDSLVVGENEILGQIKDAFAVAQQAGACGPALSALFRGAIECGKRVRAETEVGCLQRSVATVVVELARELSPDLAHHCALLVGAGKISAMTARALKQAGLEFILVTNRTFARAQKLAAAYGGQAVHFDALPETLAAADIVICSTGAPHIVLHRQAVAAAMAARPERPLLVADLAVPRDVDPAIAGIPHVRLIDIDGLQATAERGRPAGEARACIECIVAEESAAFLDWLEQRRAAALIGALHARAQAIGRAQAQKTARRLGLANAAQQAALEAMADAVTGQLLHAPIAFLKEHAGEDADDMIRKMFDL